MIVAVAEWHLAPPADRRLHGASDSWPLISIFPLCKRKGKNESIRTENDRKINTKQKNFFLFNLDFCFVFLIFDFFSLFCFLTNIQKYIQAQSFSNHFKKQVDLNRSGQVFAIKSKKPLVRINIIRFCFVSFRKRGNWDGWWKNNKHFHLINWKKLKI